MATKKETSTKAKPTAKAKSAAPTPAKKAASAAGTVKPLKETFNKSSLVMHIAEHSGVETKAVKAVLATLESTMVGALHKKGASEFTLPGLLKIGVQKIPAKPKRVGKDPFTGEQREFAAKPASVRVKVRALKKLKDAAA